MNSYFELNEGEHETCDYCNKAWNPGDTVMVSNDNEHIFCNVEHENAWRKLHKTPEKVMSTFDACAIVEGFDGQDHTEEEVIEAMQLLIDSGTCWSLQGFYGRLARSLIEAGLCTEGKG